MQVLISYLSKHKWVVVFALFFLAAVNIGFSLLDPYITGRIVDGAIERRNSINYDEYPALYFWLVMRLALPWYRV